MPDSVNFHIDPEISSDLSQYWKLYGKGGNWTTDNEGIVDKSCWQIEPTDNGSTNAELILNHSMNSTDDNRYLSFWNSYNISNGTELIIGLRDGDGNLDVVEKIGYRGMKRSTTDLQESEWRIIVLNLTPLLSDTNNKNLTFIFTSNGNASNDYWKIDSITITTSEPTSPANITLSKKPRAHIDRITPWNPTHTDSVRFEGHGTDNGEIVRYLWFNSTGEVFYNGTDSSFRSFAFSNGTHSIFLKVRDNDGFWSEEVEYTFIINGKPFAKIEEISPNPIIEGNDLTFIGSGTDDGDIVRYIWKLDDEEIYNGTKNKFITSSSPPGIHNVFLRVMDNGGAISEEVKINLEVKPDGDRDGIIDTADAFPMDPAASMDSDGDGYPDEWNDGKTEEDSTTGLKLDKYPDDPKRWKEEGGDGGGFLPGFELIILIFSVIISMTLKRKELLVTNRPRS